ncbi:MAG: Lrp/AsnC family transcriptional regulator [Candidatus Marinimicrobia bacterium]|nr:Lrp/AsnC family transcriptional regulator [Candidatus Neomarinimicrobiota bacterium]
MLDNKDTIILDILQKDGRATAKDIAKQVNLSIPAVLERIKKLVDSGIIHEFRAILEPKQVNYDVSAFILVMMASSDYYESLVKKANQSDEVLECHSITGEGSHILKIRTQNTSTLEKLLSTIQKWPGVVRTHTMIVMSTFKEDTYLSLMQGQ